MDEQRVRDLAAGMAAPHVAGELGDLARAVVAEAQAIEVASAQREALFGDAAQRKSEAQAKRAGEDLQGALFGGPPRNRHERRRWAKLQRGGR